MKKKYFWTEAQDEMIMEIYPDFGSKHLAKHFGVSRNVIQHRAKELNVKFSNRNFKWVEDQIEIVKQKYITSGPVKLANELGISSEIVGTLARKLGLFTRNRPKVTPQEILEVISKRYVTEGGVALAKELELDVDRIRKEASKLGLHTKVGYKLAGRIKAENSTSCDIRYFDKWTPNMAYVLGFLFADGNVNKEKTTITINLSKKDICVLQHIKKELKTNQEIKETPERIDERTGKLRKKGVGLYVCSTIMAESLGELGLHPRKTYNDDPFPQVPEEMLPHLIRGWFDGDGHVCLYKYGKNDGFEGCSIGIVGSPKCIEGIRDSLVKFANMTTQPIKYIQGKTCIYCTVSWSGNDDLNSFYKYIHANNSGFCLQRKKANLEKWRSKPRKSLVKIPWTQEELDKVKELYHKIGLEKLAKLLGRGRTVLHWQIRKLGLKPINKKWKEDEILILKEKFNSEGAASVARILDRNVDVVYFKAKQLNLS